jgi:NAD-dependent histone deacetylase SIR2
LTRISPNYVDEKVPQIYISREPAHHINFDITLLGYCDDVVAELSRRAGWRIEHDKIDEKTTFIATPGGAGGGDTGCWNVAASSSLSVGDSSAPSSAIVAA